MTDVELYKEDMNGIYYKLIKDLLEAKELLIKGIEKIERKF